MERHHLDSEKKCLCRWIQQVIEPKKITSKVPTEAMRKVLHPADLQFQIARGRVYQLLEDLGYDTIKVGHFMPSFDIVFLTYQHPFILDIYAKKRCHDSKHAIQDELVVDILDPRFGPYGRNIPDYQSLYSHIMRFDPDAPLYHLWARQIKDPRWIQRAREFKKEMVCKCHNIKPERYIEIDRSKLFDTVNSESMLYTDELQKVICP